MKAKLIFLPSLLIKLKHLNILYAIKINLLKPINIVIIHLYCSSLIQLSIVQHLDLEILLCSVHNGLLILDLEYFNCYHLNI